MGVKWKQVNTDNDCQLVHHPVVNTKASYQAALNEAKQYEQTKI